MFEILKRKRYRLLRGQPPDPEDSVDGQQLGRRRRAGRAGRERHGYGRQTERPAGKEAEGQRADGGH
jgi:hypothetical protein